MSRPSFDEIYMCFAHHLSQRSTCDRAKVGCVIVSSDNQRVLSLGYNGGPRGLWNECQSSQPGLCQHIHSEINALLKLDYNDSVKKKLYTTTEPCLPCSIAIINSSVSEVIYDREYRLHDGLDLLRSAGISVRRFHGEDCPNVPGDPAGPSS